MGSAWPVNRSVSMMGGCKISSQAFQLGPGWLTLHNIRIDQFNSNGGITEMRWGQHRLVYDHNTLTLDGHGIDAYRLCRYYTNDMDWDEFLRRVEEQQLEQVGGSSADADQLEGNDEETEDETKACSVCLTNVKCCLVQPCGHLCLCIGCSRAVERKCPMCRKPITRIQRIYA